MSVALRKVLALGGRAGSRELRIWASNELKGYASTEDLPPFRQLVGSLRVDWMNLAWRRQGEIVSKLALPDPVRHYYDEGVPIRQGIGEVEDMVVAARANEGHMALSFPHGPEVALLMTKQNEAGQQVDKIYWLVSDVELASIVHHVRTVLVEFIAELRAGMPDQDRLPSPEVTDQAIHVAIHGDSNRVEVASSGNVGGAKSSHMEVVSEEPGLKRWQIVVGAATILAAVVGLVSLFL